MYLEIKENENTSHLTLWDATKTEGRKQFIALNSDIKKEESPHIKDQRFHLKKIKNKVNPKQAGERKQQQSKLKSMKMIKQKSNRDNHKTKT